MFAKLCLLQAHSDNIWNGEYYGLHTPAIQLVSFNDTNDADLKNSPAHSVSEVNLASLPFSLQCTVDVDDILPGALHPLFCF